MFVTAPARFLLLASLLTFLPTIPSVSAHVVVHPDRIGVASWETFTVAVPSEKDLSTISVRLLLPPELKHVTPTVKPGWFLDMAKSGTGDKAVTTEITWMGGNIHAGFRDEFTFSAQVPAEESTLVWKAYQTYEDGSVVSWDADPAAQGNADHTSNAGALQSGPSSMTNVTNDLQSDEFFSIRTQILGAFFLSLVAIVLSGIALVRRPKDRVPRWENDA